MKEKILTIIFSLFCLTAAGQNNQNSTLLGDVNGDGKVDVADIVTTVNNILGQDPENFKKENADINHDGNVDYNDLADLTSIAMSFSKDNSVKGLVTDDYLEGSKTCLFSNGWALSIIPDTLSNYMILIDSLDFIKNTWDESKKVAIYCDPSHRPLIALNDQYTYLFNNYDEEGYDLKVLKSNEEIFEKHVSNITPSKTRGANWNQEINSIGDEINGALFLYDNINTIYNPNAFNIGMLIASWINTLYAKPGTTQDAYSWGIASLGVLFAPGALAYVGLALATKQLILSKAREEAEKMIGKGKVNITSAKRVDGNSAIINFQISGLLSGSSGNAYYQINYWPLINGERSNIIYSTDCDIASNGEKSVEIHNMNGGEYGFQVIVFPQIFIGHHNLVNLYKIPSNIVILSIPPIFIEEIKQDYTFYSEDYISASMKINLKFASQQDEAVLSYFDVYGLNVSTDFNNSNIDEYISVKENGGLEFYFTLDIPKEEFTFDGEKGSCINKITFKTYSIDGFGIKKFYDQNKPLIVCDIPKPPKATTGECLEKSQRSATVSCTYENVPENGICGVEYTWPNGSMSKNIGRVEGTQKIQLNGLEPGTVYTYCAYIETNDKTYYGEEKTVTTKESLPDLSGTWSCTVYKDNGSVLDTPTLKLSSDGKATLSGSSFSSEDRDGSWNINADGKVGISFSWAGASTYNPVWFGETYSGTISDLSNPSSIEGRVYRGWAGLNEHGKTYKFSMTR